VKDARQDDMAGQPGKEKNVQGQVDATVTHWCHDTTRALLTNASVTMVMCRGDLRRRISALDGSRPKDVHAYKLVLPMC
jgi:hypothetical protein